VSQTGIKVTLLGSLSGVVCSTTYGSYSEQELL